MVVRLAGKDINICDAWDITTGSNNIIVAVLDHGIELEHPDLGNIHPISFDSETYTSPSLLRGPHGTACAGIIGATKDNNIGIAGIVPDAPLMSVSNTLTFGINLIQSLADGINWSWENGASVISNSWGHNSLQDVLIDDAIDDALSFGRNGLGTVVVFITHNQNSQVVYPANSHPDILTVGAYESMWRKKKLRLM
jgi:serine protease